MVEYESVMKKIAANLRNLISARGTSQQEVADLMGLSQSSVSKWANAKVMPDLKFENSTYRISDETWNRKPVIDKAELEAMELLHNRGIIDDTKFYGYITEKLKEIAE